MIVKLWTVEMVNCVWKALLRETQFKFMYKQPLMEKIIKTSE